MENKITFSDMWVELDDLLFMLLCSCENRPYRGCDATKEYQFGIWHYLSKFVRVDTTFYRWDSGYNDYM